MPGALHGFTMSAAGLAPMQPAKVHSLYSNSQMRHMTHDVLLSSHVGIQQSMLLELRIQQASR